MGGVLAGAAGPIVGRDRELARIAALLDDALASRGRLVLCTGEAGDFVILRTDALTRYTDYRRCCE